VFGRIYKEKYMDNDAVSSRSVDAKSTTSSSSKKRNKSRSRGFFGGRKKSVAS